MPGDEEELETEKAEEGSLTTSILARGSEVDGSLIIKAPGGRLGDFQAGEASIYSRTARRVMFDRVAKRTCRRRLGTTFNSMTHLLTERTNSRESRARYSYSSDNTIFKLNINPFFNFLSRINERVDFCNFNV